MILTLKFKPPGKPWSTNQGYAMNRFERAKVVSLWRETAMWEARALNIEPFTSKVKVGISIPFDSNRRRDPMNYCGTVLKSVIDGLTDAGWWPDDNSDYVYHLEPDLRKDPQGDIIITILEDTDDV